nr:MAG TPA: hypothetical protein [Caudoviricetes sp.]
MIGREKSLLINYYICKLVPMVQHSFCTSVYFKICKQVPIM